MLQKENDNILIYKKEIQHLNFRNEQLHNEIEDLHKEKEKIEND